MHIKTRQKVTLLSLFLDRGPYQSLKIVQISSQASIGTSTSHSIETVTCKIAVDDKLTEVKYNGEELTASNEGHLPSNTVHFGCCHLRKAEFTAHESPYPGDLYVKGYNGRKGKCGGGNIATLVHCTSTQTESPWHNFVSDTKHWRDDDEKDVCTSGGPHMVLEGATGIWQDKNGGTKDAKLVGTPNSKGEETWSSKT